LIVNLLPFPGPEKTISKFQIARGLPNHFSSTNPRTVELAKFLCELITETMKVAEKRIENVPEHLKCPDDELCREILGSFHLCKTTSKFWFAEVFRSKKADTELTKVAEKFDSKLMKGEAPYIHTR
jgi:hypothetical protein